MTRFTFGGGAADFTFAEHMVGGQDYVTLAPATITFWSAQTGGTNYTDLVLNGVSVSSITASSSGGIPSFQGPDGITSMWADGGAGRVRMYAYDAYADTTDAAVATAVEDPGSATTAALSATYGSVTVHGATAGTVRPTTSLPVLWIGTVTPANAVNTDTWLNSSTGDEQVKIAGSFIALNKANNDASYVLRGGQMLTPEEFGAKGDGVTITDASITSGSPTLGTAHTFTSADAGKPIVILPAAGSSQATFATTILSVAGGVATLAANAPYSGSGLEATFATDDSTALANWLADTRRLTRLLPGRIYGFTGMLKITDNYDVVCAQGAVLSVIAQVATPSTWPANTRAVPSAIYSDHASLIQSKSWTGATIDLNGLCTDGFAPKWVRQYTARGVKVRGGVSGGRAYIFGDDWLTATSYQVNVDNCLGWRDYGTVPRSTSSLNGVSLGTGLTVTASTDTITKTAHGLVNGQTFVVTAKTGATGLLTNTTYYVAAATANTFKVANRAGVTQTILDITADGTADVTYYPLPGSVGLTFTESCTDSNVTGKTTMMGYQVGYETKTGNNRFGPSTHAWSRPGIGLMDYGFDDYNGFCYFTETYADTPQLGGYRCRSTTNPSFFTGPTAYMGSVGGVDNVAFGFIMDGARVGHTFASPKVIGSSSSLRFLAAMATPSGNIISPSYPWSNSYQANVTNTASDTPPPEKTNTQTSTSAQLFTANHGQIVPLTNSSPITFTINASVFGGGNWCDIVQGGAGQVTIAAGAGVTLVSRAGLKTVGQGSVVRIVRDSAAEVFYISGDLEAANPNVPALSGNYFYPVSGASNGTSNTLGNNTLRLVPFYLPVATTITKLGAEVTATGDAGSKVRLGLYADNGSMYPGALLVDAGQIAGDSATVQEITLGTPLALAAGWYWIGAAVQAAATTQPTLRTINNSTVGTVVLPIGTTIPSSNGTVIGYSQTSVSAGLPSTFTATLSAISAAPRLFAKAA